MTDRRYQDELYPQFKESESPNEDDIEEEQSHIEDNTKEDPSSSSDDDSQAVPNAITIATEDTKEMRKMHRLSSSSSPQKKKPEKNNKKPEDLHVLDWNNLPPHPEWLLNHERESAEDLLTKGKTLLKYDTV